MGVFESMSTARKIILAILITIIFIISGYFFYLYLAGKLPKISSPPESMPRGTIDPDIELDIYDSKKAFYGTTLLADNHKVESPRVIEVNMLGEIIWEYILPQDLKKYTNPGFDAEKLTNGHVLLLLPLKGVLEIDQEGNIAWSYLDPKVSHDADRLPNGNTIMVFGGDDQKTDAQVKEVNPQGEIVWSWQAKDHFAKPPYDGIYRQGWTHTNAVTRLTNGNTLISLRNFHLLVEVDPQGKVVRTIGEDILENQHDPEFLANGNILVANHKEPHQAMEIDPETSKIIWEYTIANRKNWPVRDTDRLANGNTLITGTVKIVEITPKGEIVWRLGLKNTTFNSPEEASGRGFYKAERIPVQ